MRKQNSEFKTSFVTQIGKQIANRDYHGFVELDDFACWVVASGIGDDQTQVGAKMAVQGVLAAFEQKPGISKRRVKEYLKTAHRVLKRESTQTRLKASIMIIVTDYMKIRYAHAGNTRLYLLHNKEIVFQSKDQSYYQLKVTDGTYSATHEMGLRERNNLTNYVGIPKGFKKRTSKKIKLKETYTLLVTTVGFWEHVDRIELIDAVEDKQTPEDVTDELEELVLLRNPKVLQSFTISAIFVNKLFLKENKVLKRIKMAFLILLPILIILGIWLFMQHRSNQIQRELIEQIIMHEMDAIDYVYHGSYARGLEQFNEAISLLGSVRNFEGETDLRLRHRVTRLIVDGNTEIERESFERAHGYFTRARHHFLDSADELSMFNSEAITNRIHYIDTRLHIEELISLGDLQASLNQYERALDTYRAARTIVMGLNNLGLMQRLSINIETVQSLYDDGLIRQARAEAQEITLQAENAKDLAPEEVAALFEDVARIYQNVGLHEDATRSRTRADDIRNEGIAHNHQEQQRVAIELESNGDRALLEGDYETALVYYQSAERIYRSIQSEFNITLITQKILATNDLINARNQRDNQEQEPIQESTTSTSKADVETNVVEEES